MTDSSLRDTTASRFFLPLAVLLFGLVLSAAGANWLHDDLEAQALSDLDRHAQRVADDVTRRFRLPVYGLGGARGVFAANGGTVRRTPFHDYVESRDLPSAFPGVRGFGFVQRVVRNQLDEFIAAERADGAPDFSVKSFAASPYDDLYVAKFIEPLPPNLNALGLDLGSERLRREGVEQAINSGEPTLTAVLTLVQDERRSPGFLLFVPVYRHGADPSTPAQRRKALVGLLYAPIVASELLGGATAAASGMVDFDLFDASSDATSQHAFFTSNTAARTSRYHAKRLLRAGRGLTLMVSSTPRFEATVPLMAPWFTFGGGALVSALLAAMLLQQSSGRRRAEDLATAMTADLARLAQVVKHTSNSVVITDPDLRIVWINEGFTRTSGYTLDEARGRTHDNLLGDGTGEPAVLKQLADSVLASEGCRVEILYRAKDGRNYWLDAEFQPLHGADGTLTGFMEIGSDVTERRAAQAALEASERENQGLLRTIDLHAIVSVADRAGRITGANDAFCKISGYAREELIGQNHRIVNSGLQPDSLWIEMWRSVTTGSAWRGEVCNRAKDGTLYWVDTVIAPFLGADGRVEKYISIRTDITASKNAARELARERARLDNILQGTNVGTWEWNVESGEMRVNERLALIIGFTLDELAPLTLESWSTRAHPDDISRSAELLQEHFAGLQPTYECEIRVQHKAGHWVWVLVRGKLFSRNDDGRPRWMAGTHMDITQRKRAEEGLKASQAFLDKTGRIAGVGGWSMDFETGEIQWTAETCRIHDCEPGHRPTIAESIGFFDAEAQRTVQRAVQRTMDLGEGHDLELPMTTAKGRKVWVRAVGAAELVDGKPARLVGAMQDITARRQMEIELRQNNEVMGAVLENLPCGLSVFDGDLKLMAANQQFRKLLDLPDALFDRRETNFEDIIRFNADRGEYGEVDPDGTVRSIVERARTPTQQHQFERVRPNGLPLEIRGAPMPGGGFVTTYTDITERRKAEFELRSMAHEMDRLAQVARRTSNAVVITDAERRITWVNEGFERISGYSAAEVMGKSPGALLQYEGTDAATVTRMREALDAGRNFNDTIVNRSKDGRIYRLEIEIQPLHAADGSLSGFMAVESDITKLVRATEAAQEATRAKSQFLANMSHEIRTPMNAIIGMTGLVLDSKLEGDQRELLEIVKTAGDALLSLINDILDFSKIEAGQMTLEMAEFDLHDCVRGATQMLAEKAREKGIALEWTLGRQVPRIVTGDAHRLRQVLINLLSNAVKFTSTGWVLLSVAAGQASDESGAEVQTLEFRIRDTGPGIPADKLEQIFTPFGQADGSITRKFGGTGLGLSISTELVEKMGGQIGVESTVGEGSTFHFSVRLPVAAALPDAASSAFAALPVPPSTKVLVLDRAPMPDKVLVQCLQQWHMVPRLVRTPAQALQPSKDAAAGREPLIVKASWLPVIGAAQWAELCIGRPVMTRILLQDAAATAEQEAQFGHRMPWPGATASTLFDALAIATSVTDNSADGAAAAVDATVNTEARYVLLVDDIAVNRKLAVRLLENMGHVVAVATNGLEAVQHIEREAVDLVLMDLQMPVMDGFQATERIQQLEAGKARKTPIVAMTAHALQEERQRCLDAGMLGHVSKPISKQALRAAVQQHALRRAPGTLPEKATVFESPGVGRAVTSAPEAESTAIVPPMPMPVPVPVPMPMPAEPPAVPASAVPPRAGLRDEATALEHLDGDRELLDELVEMFMSALDEQVAELRRVGTSDLPKLAKLAHAQKGSAGAVGATAARASASALETASNAGDAASAARLLGELLADLQALQQEHEATAHAG